MSRRNSIDNNNNLPEYPPENPWVDSAPLESVVFPNIAPHLTPQDVMSAAQVNRFWNENANNFTLWSGFTGGCVTSDKISDYKIVAQLQQCAPIFMRIFSKFKKADADIKTLLELINALAEACSTTPTKILQLLAMIDHLLPFYNDFGPDEILSLLQFTSVLITTFKFSFNLAAGMTTFFLVSGLMLPIMLFLSLEKENVEQFERLVSRKDFLDIFPLLSFHIFVNNSAYTYDNPGQDMLNALNAIERFLDDPEAKENEETKAFMDDIDLIRPDTKMLEKFGSYEFNDFIALKILDGCREANNEKFLSLIKEQAKHGGVSLFQSLHKVLSPFRHDGRCKITLNDDEIVQLFAEQVNPEPGFSCGH